MHIPAAGEGFSVVSRQQVLRAMWLRERAAPLAGSRTQSEVHLHGIYGPRHAGLCSCKEGRVNLFP